MWSSRRKDVQDQIVRRRIGSIAQHARRLFISDRTVFGNEVLSYPQQELTGVLGDVARDGGIGTWIVHPFPPVLASSPLEDRSLYAFWATSRPCRIKVSAASAQRDKKVGRSARCALENACRT